MTAAELERLTIEQLNALYARISSDVANCRIGGFEGIRLGQMIEAAKRAKRPRGCNYLKPRKKPCESQYKAVTPD